MASASTLGLFSEELEVTDHGVSTTKPITRGIARVLMPNRAQLELQASNLDSLLPEGHRARIVWAYVEQADLSRM